MSGYVNYEYDSLGNLIVSWDSAGIKEGFAYDAADNRTQNVVSSGAPPPPPASQAMMEPGGSGGMASGPPLGEAAADSAA
jgi:YD repeat-containing protein